MEEESVEEIETKTNYYYLLPDFLAQDQKLKIKIKKGGYLMQTLLDLSESWSKQQNEESKQKRDQDIKENNTMGLAIWSMQRLKQVVSDDLVAVDFSEFITQLERLIPNNSSDSGYNLNQISPYFYDTAIHVSNKKIIYERALQAVSETNSNHIPNPKNFGAEPNTKIKHGEEMKEHLKNWFIKRFRFISKSAAHNKPEDCSAVKSNLCQKEREIFDTTFKAVSSFDDFINQIQK